MGLTIGGGRQCSSQQMQDGLLVVVDHHSVLVKRQYPNPRHYQKMVRPGGNAKGLCFRSLSRTMCVE